MSFDLATQKAIFDALTSSGQETLILDFAADSYAIGDADRQQALDDLNALVTGIYDHVPQPQDGGNPAAFPYLVIGDDSWRDWSSDTETGGEGTLTFHTWSRKLGKKETKQIQAAVYAALNRATLTITGYSAVTCDYETSDSFVDSDGITRHGVQTFRILVTTA